MTSAAFLISVKDGPWSARWLPSHNIDDVIGAHADERPSGSLQIVGFEPGHPRNPGQHPWANLLRVMERKHRVGPTWPLQHSV
jgi:hypothetical protein